jgi:3-hydroxyisobutyrate dehydrogenase
MGVNIAQRLLDGGHELSVWSRTAEKTKPLLDLGARVVEAPAALGQKNEVVFTILTDAAAIEAVYYGDAGLLSGDVRDRLFIEMTTVRPETQVSLAEKVRAKGAIFVECPVSGSVGPARQGQLIGLVGAEARDLARARPILEHLCRRIEHVGPVGSGSLVKLAVNVPLNVYWQALGEALALTREIGIRPDQMMDILVDTPAAPNMLKVLGPAVARWLSGESTNTVGYYIDGAVKDLQQTLAEGSARDIDLPLVERTLACFQEASRGGYGSAPGAMLSVYWAKRKK